MYANSHHFKVSQKNLLTYALKNIRTTLPLLIIKALDAVVILFAFVYLILKATKSFSS